MKFVIAPDKFKGSLTGMEFCDIVGETLQKKFPAAEIVKLPLADGGDGTVDVIQKYWEAEIIKPTVNDPLFRPIKAKYILTKDKKTAFVEMADASGHHLLQTEELNCVHTTTLGTGELILDAIEKGAKQIYLGIGGSATNDAGMGMAQALEYSFVDGNGKKLKPIGMHLGEVAEIRPPEHIDLSSIVFKVACDVNNPFYGVNGAAKIYAKQKGASDSDIEILDNGLEHFAKIVKNHFGIDLQKVSGAGAAGGLGGGAVAFLDAELVSGIELVKEIADFDAKIADADWIITGEGKLDDQTLSGKTIGGTLSSAKKAGAKVAALCGLVELSNKEILKMGIDYAVSISEGMPSLEEAIKRTPENLESAVGGFCKWFKTQN